MEIRDFGKEFVFNTSRSGGPGGQNVNKVESKVELRFDVPNSALLTEEEKATLLEKLSNYLTTEGILQVVSQAERSQLLNKELVVKKFYQLLKKAFTKPKPRKATKPSRAMVQRRLESKRREGEKKANRRKID